MHILKIIKYLSFSFIIVLASLVAAEQENNFAFNLKNPAWSATVVQAVELESLLTTSYIASSFDMRVYLGKTDKIARFRGEVYLAILSNRIKAVFKPRAEDEMENAFAEVVAYDCAKYLAVNGLGYVMVPPTVMTEFQGRKGSLQYFVESPFDLWIDDQRALAMSKVPVGHIRHASLFLAILGQWDQHPGNWMVTKDYKIALIDNEGIVNRKTFKPDSKNYSRPYVRVHHNIELEAQEMNFGVLERSASQDDFANIFGRYLPQQRVKSLHSVASSQDGGCFNYAIGKGGVWVQYHVNNPRAFPVLPEVHKSYDDVLTFQRMNESIGMLLAPLIATDEQRFSGDFLQEVKERFSAIDLVNP
jgi:hypothetical protein